MYKTHPTMHPHKAATVVFKSEDDDDDDKALFAVLLGEDIVSKARLAPIGI